MRFSLPPRRRLLAGGLAAMALAAGAAGIAVAQGGGDDHEPSYRSSVTGPEPQDEAAEEQQLRSVAKITPEQAREAALGAVPGTATDPKLENENGNVVYEVLVTDSQGAVTEVMVDAGNGSVLAREAEEGDDDDDEDDDANEDKDEDGDD